MKDFPIPVVGIGVGPGSQPEEDESLQYMPMPQGMETFRPPILPEPEEIAAREQAHRALREALTALDDARRNGGNRSVDLLGLPAADLQLVNQVLGEGEVSALVKSDGDASHELRVQESVFAGVWRRPEKATKQLECAINQVNAHATGFHRDASRAMRDAEVSWNVDPPSLHFNSWH